LLTRSLLQIGGVTESAGSNSLLIWNKTTEIVL